MTTFSEDIEARNEARRRGVDEGIRMEREACIRWLELEAAQASNPAHARCMRDVAHDLRNGSHVKQP